MNIGTLDVYGRPTININMRCIEILAPLVVNEYVRD